MKKLLFILSVLVVFSCARRGSITGGPKDEQAPILLYSNPEEGEINFQGNKVRIFFDEYVQIKNPERIIITPFMDKKPGIIPIYSPRKMVEVKFKEPLKPNTTYNIEFGDNVEDYNEGNRYEGLSFVFSTGDYLDSLSVVGQVLDPYNEEKSKLSEVIISLYTMDSTYTDSTVIKSKPDYVTYPNEEGFFILKNLKPNKYKIFGLLDADADYKYFPTSDRIAFLQDTLEVKEDTLTVDLQLFLEENPFAVYPPDQSDSLKINFTIDGNKDNDVTIEPVKEILKDSLLKISFVDSIAFYHRFPKKDSVEFYVKKAGKIIDTAVVRIRTQELTEFKFNPLGLETVPLKNFVLKSNHPIISLDTTKIQLMKKDSSLVSFIPEISENKMEVLLFKIDYNQKYSLTFYPDAIETFYEKNTDTINFIIQTKTKDSYGMIQLELKNKPDFPVIINLKNSKEEVLRTRTVTSLTNEILLFKNLEPGSYTFEMIADENKDGNWNTGNYLEKKQPETILNYEKPIEVKANWELKEIWSYPTPKNENDSINKTEETITKTNPPKQEESVF